MTGLLQLIVFGERKYGYVWRYGRKSMFYYISFSIGRFSFGPSDIRSLTRKDLIFRRRKLLVAPGGEYINVKTYLHFFTWKVQSNNK